MKPILCPVLLSQVSFPLHLLSSSPMMTLPFASPTQCLDYISAHKHTLHKMKTEGGRWAELIKGGFLRFNFSMQGTYESYGPATEGGQHSILKRKMESHPPFLPTWRGDQSWSERHCDQRLWLKGEGYLEFVWGTSSRRMNLFSAVVQRPRKQQLSERPILAPGTWPHLPVVCHSFPLLLLCISMSH